MQLQPAASTSLHSVLSGLPFPADDHPQYMCLPGRAGGQILHGGTGSTDQLVLLGSTDPALGRVMVNSPLEVGDVKAGDSVAIRYRPTFATNGGYVGGCLTSSPTVTIDNGLFIWGLFAETAIYKQAAAPGFAAYTLLNCLPLIKNEGNFNLTQALVINVGVCHERNTSGTSTTPSTVGMNFSPLTRARAFGAVMTRTVGMTAIRCAPTFSTVIGSTVNMGTVIGLQCNGPAPGLFQTSSGIETLTAYYGLDYANITMASSGDKVVVRSAMTKAANRWFLQNNGGASSDLGTGHLLNCGVLQCLGNTILCSLSLGANAGDVIIYWNGTREVHNPLVGDDLEMLYAVGAHTLQSANFGTASEYRMGFDRFALGQIGAVGNQFTVLVAPAGRLAMLAADWTDVLLTDAGNFDVNGFAVPNASRLSLNAITLAALGSGSLADLATLRIGGMTTAVIGVDATSAMHVTGRTVLQGSLNLAPTSPGQLTADVNDYAGHLAGNSQRALLRLSSDASRTITGFDKTISRKNDTIWLTNVGSFDVVLAHENAGSVATNRIISPTTANLALGPDESAMLWYDGTTTRWRILYHTGA